MNLADAWRCPWIRANLMPTAVAIALGVALAWVAPPAAGVEAPQEAGAAPGPPRLTRPLAPETIARLLDEAESLYRARQWQPAMDAYKGIVSLDGGNPRAWLRIGNLHQQRNQWLQAASAYRKAATKPETSAVDPEVRGKALVNLALVNLELARAALSEIGEAGPALASARASAAEQLADLQRQVTSAEAAPRPAPSSTLAPAPRLPPVSPLVPALPPAPAPPTAPSNATPKPPLRPAARAGASAPPSTPRAATPSAPPAAARGPAIEYLRGGPSP